MTLQTSGVITLSDVDVELGRTATANITMNEPAVRSLAASAPPPPTDPSAPNSLIKMSYFYGKSNTKYYTWTGTGASAGNNLNMFTLFGNPTSAATYVFTNNGEIGGNPALSTGNFPAGSKIYIINNGRIQGAGGRGGWYNSNGTQTLPVAGGTALYITTPVYEIQNSGVISGGGGGGGGSAEWGGSNDNNAPGGGGAGIPVGAAGAVTWAPGYTYYPNAGGIDLGGTSGYNASVGKGGDRGVAGNPGAAIGSSSNYAQGGAAAGASVVFAGSGSIGNSKYVISADTANLTINLAEQPGYVAGSSQLTVVVNPGVYVYATVDNTPALNIIGGAAGNSVALINNGYIMGIAGHADIYKGAAATVGGPAINTARTLTINNVGYIGGGGGYGGGWFGGGGLGAGSGTPGGAGGQFPGTGGAGAYSADDSSVAGAAGGAGSGGSAVGNTAGTANDSFANASGGGGGWGAAGGIGYGQENATTIQITCYGGNGGAAGSAATNGSASSWSASYPGGAGGKAIQTNGNGVTITAGAARVYGIVG